MTSAEEHAWVLAMIAMIGTVLAGLFKLVAKNGCSVACWHPNGKQCCSTDCEEGRAPVLAKQISNNKE